MNFENLKLKDISYVVKFSPSVKNWSSKQRINHIIGIQFNGKVVHDLGYKKFTIGENCIYFLNQKDSFNAKVIQQSSAFSIHFTTYEPISTDSFSINIKDASEISSLINKIENLQIQYPAGNNLSASTFYALCALFDNIRAREYIRTDDRILKSKDYLDMHFKEEHCLENALKISQLSRRRFNDLFKKQFNSTPNKYIILKKIKLAQNLLSVGLLSITEISNLCGINDIYYFSKLFKSVVGITPKDYRKSTKTNTKNFP